MINIGFRAHDLGKQNIEDLSSKISGYGFTSIQLALQKSIDFIESDYGKLSPGLGNYIRNSFKSKNIDIAVLGCYINPVHPDRTIRNMELDRFIEHLGVCRSFGCSIVGTETGSPLADCGFTQDIYLEETFWDFISSLKILVKAAEKFGVIVGIEGVADKHTIFSHERMQRVLEIIPSPNLGVIYDPVNFLPNNRLDESDYLMEEAFLLFHKRIVAIHAKDYTIEGGIKNGNLPSGKGLLNYELLFKLIKQYRPYCNVLLENNRPDTINETLKFIKKFT
ncbi:MAG: sugar phosphate isomerase/epimerase [Spirochaetales bacterium]|nr:sugar phosphate isomerase/epimerase [Spirochaetales bacterium]